MKILLAAILAFCVVPVSHAQSVASSAMWAAVGVDLGTTWYGIVKDGRREANPIVTNRPAVQAAFVIGTTAAADYSAHRLNRAGHRKLALVARLLITSAHVYATAHNLRTVR